MNIDHTGNARAKHITSSGRVLEKRMFYFSPNQWRMLHALAADSDQPLGKLLVDLAFQERERRKADYQERLDRIS